MKIKPILTEKSLNLAKKGKYSFWVDPKLSKYQIKKLVGDIFAVHVKKVSTINYKKIVKKNMLRKGFKITPAKKRTIVTLAAKEKIDIFGGGKEK